MDNIPRLNCDFTKLYQPVNFELEKCWKNRSVRTHEQVHVPGLFRTFASRAEKGKNSGGGNQKGKRKWKPKAKN